MLVSLYKIKCINREDCHKEDSWLLSYAQPWGEQVAEMLIADSLRELSTFAETFAETLTLFVENIFLAFIIFIDVISFIFLRSRRFFTSNFRFLRFRFILLQQLLRLRRRPLSSFFFFLTSFQNLRAPFLSFPALISTLVPKYPFRLIQQRDHINGEHTKVESISWDFQGKSIFIIFNTVILPY